MIAVYDDGDGMSRVDRGGDSVSVPNNFVLMIDDDMIVFQTAAHGYECVNAFCRSGFDPTGLIIRNGSLVGGRIRGTRVRCLDTWTGSADPDVMASVAGIRRAIGKVGATFGITPGSSAIACWLKRWRPRGIGVTWDKWANTGDLRAMRRAVFGGRCEHPQGKGVHARGQIRPAGRPVTRLYGECLRFYDINSAYPASAREPMADIRSPREPDFCLDSYGIAHVMIDIAPGYIPALPVSVRIADKAWRLKWPRSGRVSGIWDMCAIRHAVESGCSIVRVYDHWTWSTAVRPAAAFMNALYHAKVAARSQSGVSAIKAMGRSFYGKLSQAGSKTVPIKACDLSKVLLTQTDGSVVTRSGQAVLGIECYTGPYAWVKIETDPPAHVVPMWSSQIAASVAVRLAEVERYVTEAGRPIVYMDTDSICHPGEPLLELAEGLGAWRIDSQPLEWIEIFGQKMYDTSCPDKRAAAGVPAADQTEFFRRMRNGRQEGR